MFRLISTVDAKKVYTKIAESGVVIRYRGSQKNCENCLRATIGTSEQNAMMLENLVDVTVEIINTSAK